MGFEIPTRSSRWHQTSSCWYGTAGTVPETTGLSGSAGLSMAPWLFALLRQAATVCHPTLPFALEAVLWSSSWKTTSTFIQILLPLLPKLFHKWILLDLLFLLCTWVFPHPLGDGIVPPLRVGQHCKVNYFSVCKDGCWSKEMPSAFIKRHRPSSSVPHDSTKTKQWIKVNSKFQCFDENIKVWQLSLGLWITVLLFLLLF